MISNIYSNILSFPSMKPLRADVLLLALLLTTAFPMVAEDLSVSQYGGTTPYDPNLGKFLGIQEAVPEIVQWTLALQRDRTTDLPLRYELRCAYGSTIPNKPGLGTSIRTLQKRGTWRTARGTKFNALATVHELDGGLMLYEVSPHLLHILTPDGDLQVGSGWSYTLNSTAHSEKQVDPALALTVPDMSYQIAPLSTGASVFGVFEGRTPAQGIAGQLRIPVPAAATKAKWRVTLYHDPDTLAPGTYKVEGTLFRRGVREGNWRIISGAGTVAGKTIYELSSAGKETLRLLKGDDNVLFFLGASNAPLVGNDEFSYTLNRRTAPAAVSQTEPRK